METTTLHNPDRYMADLRQILSQSRKRIELLIGAGAPTAFRVGKSHITPDDKPLIPDVAGLTEAVVKALDDKDRQVIETLKAEIGGAPNIEAILVVHPNHRLLLFREMRYCRFHHLLVDLAGRQKAYGQEQWNTGHAYRRGPQAP